MPRFGVCDWRQFAACADPPLAVVEARRSLRGWRGRVRDRLPTGASPASVLHTSEAVILESADDGVTRQARRLTRSRRRPVEWAPLGDESVVFVDATDSADGGRRVPVAVAVAALSTLTVPRRPHLAYWSGGGQRVLVRVVRGRVALGPRCGLPVVALTRLDEAARRDLQGLAIPEVSVPSWCAGLSPWQVLAFGAAVGGTGEGTFPVRRPRVEWRGVTAWFLAVTVLLAALHFCAVESRRVQELEGTVAELQRAIEIERVERR